MKLLAIIFGIAFIVWIVRAIKQAPEMPWYYDMDRKDYERYLNDKDAQDN